VAAVRRAAPQSYASGVPGRTRQPRGESVTEIDEERGGIRIQGSCDDAFRGVADAFAENFAERGEVGAAVAVHVDGRSVVDLWGGTKTKGGDPWERDTISLVFSCTKAATALCAHMLVDRGELDLHAPVVDYWPEFGANGKSQVTVAMMLNHSAGLPALRDPVKPGGYYDWDYMVERLSAEEPFWEPGTRNGYHMSTFGWTVGELVRRVSGRSLGTFFREEVAEPLGIEFWIGMPEEHDARVAPMIPFAPEPGTKPGAFEIKLLSDPKSIQALALLNSGGYDPDTKEAYRAEIGGGGGLSNARGLAGMYDPLANGGEHDGVRLLSADHIARMSEISMATGCDATLLIPTRFALGFMKAMDNRHREQGDIESALLGREAFGHVGAGGSIGFADPACGLAFGYSMNKMGAGLLLDPRGQSLVDATYRALGYRTSAPGFWTR
jgi:CubicO group peptidase (beta-lactamase class C family)